MQVNNKLIQVRVKSTGEVFNMYSYPGVRMDGRNTTFYGIPGYWKQFTEEEVEVL